MLSSVWQSRAVLAALMTLQALGHLAAQQPAASLGLEGYCPVCLIEMRQWVKGSAEFQAEFDGQIYWLANERQAETFRADPVAYAPVLGGDCVVSAAQANKRLAGSVRHAALYQQRAYLFPDRARKEIFLADPPAFLEVDLAYAGNCPVSLIDRQQEVKGKPDFTLVQDGIRYQFPGAAEMTRFEQNPANYRVQLATAAPVTSATSRSSPESPDKESIRVTGVSKCAGCDYGLKPIRHPETLGLAVASSDGKVYVIEDAHQMYPDVYDRRFDNLKLEVTGQVLQRQEQFVWLAPVSLVESR